MTGGTDIEVTSGGTINYTGGGGGGGGSGVTSIGGATGAVGNIILGRMVNDSGALTISNIAGYHANLESELTTANVGELTNLYFTDARANDALVANLNYANVDYLSNIVSSTTQIQLSSPANFIRFYFNNQSAFPNAGTYHGAIAHSHADAAMYFAHGGAWIKIIDDVSLAANLAAKLTTANTAEVTNLYYTDARTRAALSTAAGSRAYNSSTGVITIPGTSDHVTEGTTNLFFSNTRANGTISANVQHSLVRSLTLAASDETSDLTTGDNKVTFRAPFPMTLPATPKPRISVQTAPVGADILVDINEGGSTILSTKLRIDAGDKSSKDSGTPCVVSDASIADDAEITVDIDQVGSSTAGKGLKLTLYYTVTE